MVVEHFVHHAVDVQMTLDVLQLFWGNQDLHTFRRFVPEIQLRRFDQFYRVSGASSAILMDY